VNTRHDISMVFKFGKLLGGRCSFSIICRQFSKHWWETCAMHTESRESCWICRNSQQSVALFKKALRGDASTARWLRWLAEPKKNRPAADPFHGSAGRPKFNQLEMVTTFTYQPSLVRIDARNFELSW